MNEIVNLVHELSAVMDDASGGVLSVKLGRFNEPYVHVNPQWFVDNFNNFKVTRIDSDYSAKYKIETVSDGVEFFALLTEKEHAELILKSELITEGLA